MDLETADNGLMVFRSDEHLTIGWSPVKGLHASLSLYPHRASDNKARYTLTLYTQEHGREIEVEEALHVDDAGHLVGPAYLQEQVDVAVGQAIERMQMIAAQQVQQKQHAEDEYAENQAWIARCEAGEITQVFDELMVRSVQWNLDSAQELPLTFNRRPLGASELERIFGQDTQDMKALYGTYSNRDAAHQGRLISYERSFGERQGYELDWSTHPGHEADIEEPEAFPHLMFALHYGDEDACLEITAIIRAHPHHLEDASAHFSCEYALSYGEDGWLVPDPQMPEHLCKELQVIERVIVQMAIEKPERLNCLRAEREAQTAADRALMVARLSQA